MSTKKYQMWLTHNAEKQKIQLPVLPETFKVKNGSSNDSMKITGLGEVTIMQGRPAMQFSFSSFFPAAYFPGIQVKNIKKPLKLIQKINNWKEGEKPVHLICTAVGVDIYCTIEDFSYEERGGDVGTFYYDITLKEYREISKRKVKVNVKKKKAKTTKKVKNRVNNKKKPKTYTVKGGDCLWNIAKKYYGDGAEYKKIYNANKKIIGGNPNLIRAGQVLTLP